MSCGNLLVAGEGGGEGEEGGEEVSVAFPAHCESAVVAEPGDGAFDFPALGAQVFAGLDARPGDPGRDPAFAQEPHVGLEW